jgi:hypothetical protein
MRFKNDRTISVNKSVKSLPVDKRTAPKLKINDTYYISFGTNEVAPCILIAIVNEEKIRIGIKNNSKIGYGDIHIVYNYEIGTSPEEAVNNEQIF